MDGEAREEVIEMLEIAAAREEARPSGAATPRRTGIDVAAVKSIQAWRESAQAFLREVNEEDMPVPVQLKQIVERPSSGEQKMRALKEQQIIKDRMLQKEFKAKQESIEKEKKTSE